MDINDLDDIFSLDEEFEVIEKRKEEEEEKAKLIEKKNKAIQNKEELGKEEKKEDSRKTEEKKQVFPTYKKIKNFLTKRGSNFDKDIYKKIVEFDKEYNAGIHKNLSSFIKTADKEERANFRARFTSSFWVFYNKFILNFKQIHEENYFKALVRYSIISPSIVDKEIIDDFNKLDIENNTGEDVYYIDEWLEKVGNQEINPSLTDESAPSKKKAIDISQEKQKIDTLDTKIKAELSNAHKYSSQIQNSIQMIREEIESIFKAKSEFNKSPSVLNPMDTSQKESLKNISMHVRKIDACDISISRQVKAIENLKAQKDKIIDVINQSGGDYKKDGELSIDNEILKEEAKTITQMIKVSVGKTGNNFPIFAKQFFRNSFNNIGIREHVINILADIEKIDPTIFHKEFKGHLNRIAPYIILVPCYGEAGVCWQAFERGKKELSPGRICIPMYSKDLFKTIIYGVADYKWQMEKERAGQYWMSTGLTGWYYDETNKLKVKGDIKANFAEDYFLWITKESEGLQKLPKEIRAVFWRYIPFPDEIKNELSKKSYAYLDLLKKDQNRNMSDM